MKSNKCRVVHCLKSSYLPKDRSSKRELNCHKLFSQDFHPPGREVNTTPRYTFPQNVILPLIYSKAPFIFLKIIYSPLGGLHLPSSYLIWYLILNSNATSLNYSFFLGYLSPMIHILINFYLFFSC